MRAELGSFEEWSYRLQEFVQPVFGYALNRTGNRLEAEDLAQEIMLQCVKSLAGGAVVHNLESYVWSIARYTWMKTLNGRASASVYLNGMPEWADDTRHEPLEQVVANDAYRLLRREIAFLSRLQRQIVIEHYYHNRKQSEIAHALKLPGGSLSLWRIDTFWSERHGQGWRSLHFKDAQLCHAFRKGELPDDEDHREDYAFLLTNGYLLKTSDGYKLNVVWVDSPDVADHLRRAMPDLSKEYKPVVERLYSRLYEITMRNKPKFVEPQIDYMLKLSATGQALIPYVLKHLVDAGKMKVPTPEQKKKITTMAGMMYRV